MNELTNISPRFLFLLGGHDLEMIEIRNLLKAAAIPYIDRKLSWGARLSSYQDILSENANKFEYIYGIELIQDIEPPVNYILIDHHNDNARKESSIEQVANLLEIKLNDYQQLVAANDKGYIPAMVELGATSEQINEIRLNDRQAQGVTEEDEKFAEESIKTAEHFKDVITVKSLTGKFSAVSDRLYPNEKFIVYNDAKLTYYGPFIKYLKEEFKYLINQNKAYCGGNPLGFFGIAENALSAEQLDETHQKILDMTAKPFSHHIFSFPFKIDIKKTNSELKSIPISERVDLEDIKDHFLSIRLDDNLSVWEEGNDQYHPLFFNFSNYFYPFALEAMSSRPESSGHSKDNRDELIMQLSINKRLLDHSKYIIDIKDVGKFDLDIENITLDIYKTGIGILSFHLNNSKYDRLTDTLAINQYGRRIHPPFLPLDDVKNLILPDKITLILSNFLTIDEDFNNYQGNDITHVKLPDFVQELLGKEIKTRESEAEIGDMIIQWLLDDRMFVTCWIGHKELSKQFSVSYKNIDGSGSFLKDWYSLIFVDSPTPSVKNDRFFSRLIRKHTYDRWSDYGTFFGLSRYSYILLSDRSDFSTAKLLDDLKSIYFPMVKLCLAQRASILRFSQEVTWISEKVARKNEKVETKSISEISGKYLEFVNRIYFREVTAQEQGIEIYDKMQDIMRIERDVKDLNREIDELYQYANLIEDENNSKQLKSLTILGTILLIPSLFAGIFGMNIWPECLSKTLLFMKAGVVSTIGIFIFLLLWFYYKDDDFKEALNRLIKGKL